LGEDQIRIRATDLGTPYFLRNRSPDFFENPRGPGRIVVAGFAKCKAFYLPGWQSGGENARLPARRIKRC
jgi:hypothetical protein